MGGTGGMGGGGGGPLCEPDTAKACYTGAPGTENVGICKIGATLCQADGMGYGPCLGEVVPIVEECSNATDDDCNGASNEHCGLWSRRAGGIGDQRILSLATDAMGNVIATGRMLNTADFGNGVLTSAGGYDIFVAKFDGDGNTLWSKRFGGAMNDSGNAIATDPAGNIYVTGFLSGTVSFDAMMVTAVDVQDAFVLALDPAGAVVWVKTQGGMGDQHGNAIAVDVDGNVVVTGGFATEIDVGVSQYMAVDMLDGYVLKMDGGGTPIGATTFGGIGNDEGTAIATDGATNIVFAGYFDETVDFGGGVITDGGSSDTFLAKLDPMGNHLFSKGFPALGDQFPYSVALDAVGNYYLFGDFNEFVNFGGGQQASAGDYDIFVAKLDATGAHLFTKTFGGPEEDSAGGMVRDKNGDLAITCATEGVVDFGGGPISNVGMIGSSDVVVFKLSGSNGAHVWSRRFGNSADQDSRAITTDGMNNVFVAGEFSGSINFGSGSMSSNGSDDAFLAKLPP